MGTTLKAVVYSSMLPMVFSSMAWAQENTRQQNPVGQPPAGTPSTLPDVPGAPADIGGVLTPRGKLVLEPALQYSHSSVNRISFRGVEILSTFLIGTFDIEDADRDTWIASLTGRYGVTDRFEMELKIPYVYRDDTLNASSGIEGGGGSSVDITRDFSGDGLGDIELAGHYQLNNGLNGWPYFVGNLRYKSTTGEGPFDVDRNADGMEEDLPTGSGFDSIEPSLTVLYPSDPAVFFANIGYVFNFKDDVDQSVMTPSGEVFIGEVDPGDAIRLSFGMSYSINERASFMLGFKNDFIDETETEFVDTSNGNSTRQQSSTLNVGALLLGWSYQVGRDTSVNLGLELGVTEDAPDTLLTLRVPFGI